MFTVSPGPLLDLLSIVHHHDNDKHNYNTRAEVKKSFNYCLEFNTNFVYNFARIYLYFMVLRMLPRFVGACHSYWF
jgi:hypothetical protein